MKYRILWVIVLTIVAATVALAQDYSFSVPKMELHVTPNSDASVTMEYVIDFYCDQGAHPIDIVDVGLPHKDYDISNMQATLNGNPLGTIRKSEYVDIGVEVPLSPAIAPGQSGRFTFECTMPNLVYQDTTRADYASLRITPTWFDGDYLTGTTDLAIVVYLPDQIELDEILYQDKVFYQKMQIQGKKAVAWLFKDTRMDEEHMVSLSFPKREMERVVRMTKLGLLWKWWTESLPAQFLLYRGKMRMFWLVALWVGWTESPAVRVLMGIVFLVLFSIFFFRLTAGTGTCIFIPVLIGLVILWLLSPALEALFLPVFIPVWLIAGRVQGSRRREYLPAIESASGGGIKRGLAVPEAAVLLEQPLGRVLTLVIFGLLKKRLVRQTADDPLTVEIREDYQTEERRERRQAAQANGTVIRGYDQAFLEEIIESPGKPVEALNFRKAMKHLVTSTAKRMKGFDLDKTREYYRYIMAKAWREAKAIGEIEQRTEFIDDNLMWLMLDEDYHEGFTTWHRGGYYYRSAWSRPAAAATAAPAAPAPAVGGRTTLGDVTASFAGWAEHTTGRLASTMDPVSVGLTPGSIIDLSGVDKVSMDFLESMAESSGSSSGGGCACACAGCACACACAGGGR